MKKILFIIFINSTIFANVLTTVVGSGNKLNKVSKLKPAITIANITFKDLGFATKAENIQYIMNIAIKENKVESVKQYKYMEYFTNLKDGDKLLLKCLKSSSCNLDTYMNIVQKSSKVQRRRITSLEKELMTSNNAKKTRVHGRTVIKRQIFKCTKKNIALMLDRKAPIGNDNKKVNLHHLKQQKDGHLVELTETEHNTHDKVLHRYNKSKSEITDRNTKDASFRKKYWKSRAADCISRGK